MISCAYCQVQYGPTLSPVATPKSTGYLTISIVDPNRWEPLPLCQHCQQLACPDCADRLSRDATRPFRPLPEYLSVQVSWPKEYLYPPDRATLTASTDDPADLQLLLFRTEAGFGWHYYPPEVDAVSVMATIPLKFGLSCEDCLAVPLEPEEQQDSRPWPVRLCPDEATGEDGSMFSLQLRPKALSIIYADGKYEPPNWADFKYYQAAIQRGWNSKTTGVRTRVFEDGRTTKDQKDPPGDWWPDTIKPDALDHVFYGQEVDDLVHQALVEWIDQYADRHADWCSRNPGHPYSPFLRSRVAWTCLQQAARTLHPPEEQTTVFQDGDDRPLPDADILQVIPTEQGLIKVYLDHTLIEEDITKAALTVTDREGHKTRTEFQRTTKVKRVNHIDPEAFVCQTGTITPEAFLEQEEALMDQLVNLLNTSYEEKARTQLEELRSILDTTRRIKDYIPKIRDDQLTRMVRLVHYWDAYMQAHDIPKRRSVPSEQTLQARAINAQKKAKARKSTTSDPSSRLAEQTGTWRNRITVVPSQVDDLVA